MTYDDHLPSKRELILKAMELADKLAAREKLIERLFGVLDGDGISFEYGTFRSGKPATIGGIASFTVDWDTAEEPSWRGEPWDTLTKEQKFESSKFSAQHALIKELAELKSEWNDVNEAAHKAANPPKPTFVDDPAKHNLAPHLKDITNQFIRDYAAGKFNQDDTYVYPYTGSTEGMGDLPFIKWFDKDDREAYGVDGFHSGGAAYEFTPLWYGILDSYKEFDKWEVMHGGLRFENWQLDPNEYPHSRYEDIMKEAYSIFIAVYNSAKR